MSKKGAWRVEFIETLPSGTQRWRIVRSESPKKGHRIKDHESRVRKLYTTGFSDGAIGKKLIRLSSGWTDKLM